MAEIFNSEIIPVKKPIDVWNTELLSKEKWDNLFYGGQFNSTENIRCISPCRSCYESWFNVSYLDFYQNKISDLVSSGFLSNEIIDEKQIAIRGKFGEHYVYDTILGCPAHYVQVKCKNCNTEHLLVLGLQETQPGLYHGQLQGMWRIKKDE